MRWSDIPFRPAEKTLRQFAALWLLAFGGIACWQGFGREQWLVASIWAIAALTVGPLGMVKPQAVRSIYVGWMVLVFPIAWTISLVSLGLIYYGVFTPVALVFRLLGRDALQRRFQPDRETYWTAKAQATDLRSYFRQF
jgi:hypothetical protein